MRVAHGPAQIHQALLVERAGLSVRPRVAVARVVRVQVDQARHQAAPLGERRGRRRTAARHSDALTKGFFAASRSMVVFGPCPGITSALGSSL